MVRKYIKRDFTDHEYSTKYVSDEDEYIKFEIFSFDHKHTQTYIPERGTLSGENVTKTSWKSWQCYKSADMINPMEFTLNYHAAETGSYRIDVLYEQNSKMYSSSDYKLYNTGKDLTGWYDFYLTGSKSEHKAEVVTNSADTKLPKAVKKAIEKTVNRINRSDTDKPVTSKPLLFEGENNVTKRKTIFQELNAGDWKFEFAVPHNCYVLGFIVRKIRRYWGTNNDEPGSNLQFTAAKFTDSEKIKASELEVTIGYDDDFDCPLTRTGLYMDYMDEANLYVKNLEGNVVQVFGGYVSTPLLDTDMRTITIHCADRLKDGENKYILDLLKLQNGTGEASDYDGYISFEKHAQALTYLCKIYEISLNHNINGNYEVGGETFVPGFYRSFGKKKDVKSIKVSNCTAVMNNNSATLRNNPSGKKKQVFELYTPKNPIDISNYTNFHITYGLGDPKTDLPTKTTTNTDGSEVAGAQKFGKCGQSQDKKYLMAIGQPSGGRRGNFKYNQIYKTIFKNKCPHCGGELVWDSGRTDSDCVHCGSYKHSKREWGNISETEVTCKSCCADFDSVTGWDKDGKFTHKLTKVGSTVKSTKAEQNKLHNGKMYATPSGNVSISSSDIFKAIKNSVKGFRHSTGTGTTAGYLEKHGVGDCWAWSDKISKELKKYKVNHKIIQYVTGESDRHRSVVYQNSNGKYVNFPYSEYNFPRGTHATGGIKSGHVYYHYKDGGRISQAVASGSSSSSKTVEVTETAGYDKDNPIQGFIDIAYSFSNLSNAKKYHIYVDFTQIANSAYNVSGLKPVWVNNASKKITLTGIVPKMRQYRNVSEETSVYLRSISFITPIIKTSATTETTSSTKDKKANWYTSDNSTKDNSSCKMDLYSVAIDNESGSEPSDIDSCGKTVNEVMANIVELAGYDVSMEYHTHRVDDKIHFKVNTSNKKVFTATEGDNNNILEWGNISYDPANNLFNMSMCVFKNAETNKYSYIDTRHPESILNYQEQCTLETENELIGAREAYWNARHNEKYNPDQSYTFTITVAGYPDVLRGELVEVIANAEKLNTLKECQSITLEYDIHTKPVLQTEMGLGELAPDIQVAKNIKIMRDNAKSKTTSFHESASPINDASIYEWNN